MVKWTHFEVLILVFTYVNIFMNVHCNLTLDFQTMIKNHKDQFQSGLLHFEKDEIQQKWYLIFKNNADLEMNFMNTIFDIDKELKHLINLFLVHRDDLYGVETNVLDDVIDELESLQICVKNVMSALYPRFSEIENQLWKLLIAKQRFGLLPHQIKHYLQEYRSHSNESEMKYIKERLDLIKISWNKIKDEIAKLATLRNDADHLPLSEVLLNLSIYYNETESKLLKDTQEMLNEVAISCYQHCSEWNKLSLMLREFLDSNSMGQEFIAEDLYEKLLNNLKLQRSKSNPQPDFIGFWEEILLNGKACVSKALSVKTALIEKKEKIMNKTAPLQKLVTFTIDAFISMIEPIASHSKIFYASGDNTLKFISSHQLSSGQIQEINKVFKSLKLMAQQQFDFIKNSLDNFKDALNKTPTNRNDLDKLFADNYDTLNAIIRLNAKLLDEMPRDLNNLHSCITGKRRANSFGGEQIHSTLKKSKTS